MAEIIFNEIACDLRIEGFKRGTLNHSDEYKKSSVVAKLLRESTGEVFSTWIGWKDGAAEPVKGGSVAEIAWSDGERQGTCYVPVEWSDTLE